MPTIGDPQYQSLMSQLHGWRRRWDEQTNLSNHWRIAAQNAVGTEDIRSAQSKKAQADADTSAQDEYHRLCGQVNQIYGMGGHKFP
jgi:hypothetical protein